MSLHRKSPAHQLTVAVQAISSGTWNRITYTVIHIHIVTRHQGDFVTNYKDTQSGISNSVFFACPDL